MRLEKSHLVWTLFADTYVFECFSHSLCSWKNPLTVCNLFATNIFFVFFVAITPARGKLPLRLDPLRGQNCFFVFLPKPMLVENPPLSAIFFAEKFVFESFCYNSCAYEFPLPSGPSSRKKIAFQSYCHDPCSWKNPPPSGPCSRMFFHAAPPATERSTKEATDQATERSIEDGLVSIAKRIKYRVHQDN